MPCPRCGARTSWLLGNGRRRCAVCRRDWRPGRLPLRLSLPQWKALLRWFARGAASADIALETGLERKRVLRALLVVRRAIARSMLPAGRRASAHAAPAAERHRGGWRRAATSRRSRFAALGLRVDGDRAWAEVIADAEAEQVVRDVLGRHAVSRYTAIVYRGRLYRLPASGPERVPFGRVEAFWAYLQRQLRAKGGVRRERLGLYLAEFSWRYNHRKLAPAEQAAALLALLRD